MSPHSVPPFRWAAIPNGSVAATARGEKVAPKAFPATPLNPRAARVLPTPPGKGPLAPTPLRS